MHVDQILSKKGRFVATIPPSGTVAQALALLKEHNCGALVVSADEETIEGIISERDIVRSMAANPHGTVDAQVSALMSTEVQTCEDGWDIGRMVTVMTEGRFRHLPVVADGKLAGIISIGDAIKHRLDELETERSQLVDYIRDPF